MSKTRTTDILPIVPRQQVVSLPTELLVMEATAPDIRGGKRPLGRLPG